MAENQIYQGLDEDEMGYIDSLYRAQRETEEARAKAIQSHAQLFRDAQFASLSNAAAAASSAAAATTGPGPESESNVEAPIVSPASKKPLKTVGSLLAGSIRRKNLAEEPSAKRSNPNPPQVAPPTKVSPAAGLVAAYSDGETEDVPDKTTTNPSGGGLRGLLGYGDDDDDDDE